MLRMPTTRVARRRVFAARSQHLGDSCGCAMGARFTIVALIASVAWYSWQWHSASLSLGGGLLRVLACAFVAAGVGKLVGILQFRARAGRLRVK
jgi:hypothetical protein